MSTQGGQVPVLVLKEGTGRTTGREAQRSNIMAAKNVAETVKTTLVPAEWTKCS
jgi:chaperonin GroEL (HSP60 family)